MDIPLSLTNLIAQTQSTIVALQAALAASQAALAALQAAQVAVIGNPPAPTTAA